MFPGRDGQPHTCSQVPAECNCRRVRTRRGRHRPGRGGDPPTLLLQFARGGGGRRAGRHLCRLVPAARAKPHGRRRVGGGRHLLHPELVLLDQHVRRRPRGMGLCRGPGRRPSGGGRRGAGAMRGRRPARRPRLQLQAAVRDVPAARRGGRGRPSAALRMRLARVAVILGRGRGRGGGVCRLRRVQSTPGTSRRRTPNCSRRTARCTSASVAAARSPWWNWPPGRGPGWSGTPRPRCSGSFGASPAGRRRGAADRVGDRRGGCQWRSGSWLPQLLQGGPGVGAAVSDPAVRGRVVVHPGWGAGGWPTAGGRPAGSRVRVQVLGLAVDPQRLYYDRGMPPGFSIEYPMLHFEWELSHLLNRPREIVETWTAPLAPEFSPMGEPTTAPVLCC